MSEHSLMTSTTVASRHRLIYSDNQSEGNPLWSSEFNGYLV